MGRGCGVACQRQGRMMNPRGCISQTTGAGPDLQPVLVCTCHSCPRLPLAEVAKAATATGAWKAALPLCGPAFQMMPIFVYLFIAYLLNT